MQGRFSGFIKNMLTKLVIMSFMSMLVIPLSSDVKGLEVYHHIVHQYAFLNPGMREYTLG